MRNRGPAGLKTTKLLAEWWNYEGKRQSETERALRDCGSNPLAICCSLPLTLAPPDQIQQPAQSRSTPLPVAGSGVTSCFYFSCFMPDLLMMISFYLEHVSDQSPTWIHNFLQQDTSVFVFPLCFSSWFDDSCTLLMLSINIGMQYLCLYTVGTQ